VVGFAGGLVVYEFAARLVVEGEHAAQHDEVCAAAASVRGVGALDDRGKL